MRELFFHPNNGYIYLSEKADKEDLLKRGGKFVGEDIAGFKRSLQPQQQQPQQPKRK